MEQYFTGLYEGKPFIAQKVGWKWYCIGLYSPGVKVDVTSLAGSPAVTYHTSFQEAIDHLTHIKTELLQYHE